MARLYRAEAAVAPEYAAYAVDADTGALCGYAALARAQRFALGLL